MKPTKEDYVEAALVRVLDFNRCSAGHFLPAATLTAILNELRTMVDCGRALEKRERGRCVWKNGDDDVWIGTCGSKWIFLQDGPIENEVNYCLRCGDVLDVVPQEE